MLNEKPIRVAFYVRVSTDEQAREGYGVEMQIAALNEALTYKQKHSLWVHKPQWVYIDEGCSGGNLDRPQFHRMMKAVENNEIDLVAVYKIDRLSRNLSDLLSVFETLQKHESSFFSLRENIDFSGPIGRLTFQIFGALAEFERETIKMRTTEGKVMSARMGNYIGNGIPYGYKKVKNANNTKGNTLAIIESEAKKVKQMFNLFIYERKSYEDIAREFNKMKLPKAISSRQKDKLTRWTSPTVRRMLMNSSYTGRRVERIKTEEGPVQIVVPVPAIVSEIVFRQAQLLIERISETRATWGGGTNTYLLSRKIIDVVTGRIFVGVKRSKGGHSYRRKAFIDPETKIKHPNVELAADALEDYVWESVKLAIDRPRDFYKVYQEQSLPGIEMERNTELQKQMQQQIKEEERKLTSLYDDFYSGGISGERKNELEIRYRKTLEALQEKNRECELNIKRLSEMQIAVEAMERFSEEFKQALNDKTREERQVLIDLLIDHIYISYPDDKLNVLIHFRFALPKQNDGIAGYEPANGDSTQQTLPLDTSSCVIGEGSRGGYICIPIQANLAKTVINGRWRRKFVTVSPDRNSENLRNT